MEIPQKRIKGGQKMVCEQNIIPGKSRKRNDILPYLPMVNTRVKLNFYNNKVSNRKGCLKN